MEYMWVWIIGYENIRESQIKIIFYLDWYANILYFGMIVFTVKALMVQLGLIVVISYLVLFVITVFMLRSFYLIFHVLLCAFFHKFIQFLLMLLICLCSLYRFYWFQSMYFRSRLTLFFWYIESIIYTTILYLFKFYFKMI